MLNAAHGQNIPVFELEGTQAQLQMLLDFPDEGLSLLEDTLAYWHDNARALQIMLGWWLDYRPEKLAQPLPATFSEQTYQHLMISRNDARKTRLTQLPPAIMWWRSAHCIFTATIICRPFCVKLAGLVTLPSELSARKDL